MKMELDKRFFSQRNLRLALRALDIGIDNRYLMHMVEKGILPAPDVDEFTVQLWNYKRTVELIEAVYRFKNKKQEINHEVIDEILFEIKTKKKHEV